MCCFVIMNAAEALSFPVLYMMDIYRLEYVAKRSYGFITLPPGTAVAQVYRSFENVGRRDIIDVNQQSVGKLYNQTSSAGINSGRHNGNICEHSRVDGSGRP